MPGMTGLTTKLLRLTTTTHDDDDDETVPELGMLGCGLEAKGSFLQS